MNGVLILDKPAGISSARAVGRVKRLLARGTKIGHAGTLDPFATGVLLLLIGTATKLCEKLMDQPKQYAATIRFGSTTETDDPESPQQPWPSTGDTAIPSAESVKIILAKYVGRIMQQPPAFSALKVNGKRAYKLAREGKPSMLPARPITVYRIQMLSYAWPNLILNIDCGRGTYIRSLARDIGAALNVGGHLTQLRRTRIGPFGIDSAKSLSELSTESVQAAMLPPIDVIKMIAESSTTQID